MVSFLLFTDFTTIPLYCSDQVKCMLIAHCCIQHSLITARLTSERLRRIIPLSKTFTPLGVHSDLQSLWTFLKHYIDLGSVCVHMRV
jgi:hypothetical protein